MRPRRPRLRQLHFIPMSSITLQHRFASPSRWALVCFVCSNVGSVSVLPPARAVPDTPSVAVSPSLQ